MKRHLQNAKITRLFMTIFLNLYIDIIHKIAYNAIIK